MKFTVLATFAVGLLPFTLPASTFNVDFGVPDTAFVQNSSTTATYTFSPGLSIAASGYDGSVSAITAQTLAALHAKTQGGDEEGLGLAAGSNFEITPGHFIQVDLRSLQQFGASTTFQVGIGSSSGNDRYSLYLSNGKGIAGSFYQAGSSEINYKFTAAQIAATPFVSLTATAGDVLLGPGVITTAAPEPGTMLSLGAGLVFVGLRFRKAKKG